MCIISGIWGLHWNITSSALMIKLIFGWKENTCYRTLIIRGQCFFCRMCPSQQFWQGDYLSTSCQNVAISSDPGRVAQMILPQDQIGKCRWWHALKTHGSCSAQVQHRGIVQFADESQGWAKVRSEKKVRIWRFCWLISYERGVIVRPSCPEIGELFREKSR